MDIEDEFYPSPETNSESETDSIPANVLLPWCANKMKFTWYDVGEAGAVLSIPESSVSLTVSQVSFDQEKVERMWVCEAVKRKLRPSLVGNEVIISPIVMVGPQHISSQLQKPVVVSVPHIGNSGMMSSIRVLRCSVTDGAVPLPNGNVLRRGVRSRQCSIFHVHLPWLPQMYPGSWAIWCLCCCCEYWRSSKFTRKKYWCPNPNGNEKQFLRKS